MTFALHTLILIACSALAASAGPLKPADIQAERALIPASIAREKSEAIEVFLNSRQLSLAAKAMQGISQIDNQLAADTALANSNAWPEVAFGALTDKRTPLEVTVSRHSYLTHAPTNDWPCYLDMRNRRSPEANLDAGLLKKGVNVLVPRGSLMAPVCLDSNELDDYLVERLERHIPSGGYWSRLHSKEFSDEELARLRYYDYLDANVPLRSVPVFQCTELQGRNH